MRRRRVHGHTGALLLAMLVGCSGENANLPDDVVWESEHFRYHTRAGDDSTCAGITETLEAHLLAITGYLGVDPLDVGKVDYYKFVDARDLAENGECHTADGVACHVDGGGVRSAQKLDAHELVHAYVAHLGHPEPLLEEGLAQALSCAAVSLGTSAGWAEAIENQTDVYNAGAWLVARLLTKHDPSVFTRWYAQVPSSTSPSAFEQSFEDTYGLALDEEYDAALSNTIYRSSCVPAWGCSRSAMVSEDAPRGTDECADVPDRRLRVEAGSGSDGLGVVALETLGSELRAFACADAPSPPARLQSDRLHLTALWPGDYALQQDSGVGAALSASQSVPGWFGSSCEVLEPRQISADEPTVLDVPASGAPLHFLRLAFDAPRSLELLPTAGDGLELYECASCPTDPTDLSECKQLLSQSDAFRPVALGPQTTFTLAFSNVASLSGYVRLQLSPR